MQSISAWGTIWKQRNVTIATNTSSQSLARNQGQSFYDVLAATAASGRPIPVVVAATGNDGYNSAAETQYSSPYMSAALIHGAAPIIAVEAVGLSGSSVARATFSNVGGHVSAPGVAIMSTVPGNAYGLSTGTSMAAPHVTGLVSFLYSLDPLLPQPDMISNPIRDLLLDGGRGDGRIDMSDFRRWRDWLLQAENVAGLQLDGSPDHPKKDLNGDSLVQTPALENVYPRGDFNGDGMISRADAAPVRGVIGGQQVTDLAVLQQLFSDPGYASTALPGLIDSGDIEVDVGRCTEFGPKRMLSSMKEIETQLFRRIFTHADTVPRFIHTMPVHPSTISWLRSAPSGPTGSLRRLRADAGSSASSATRAAA